MFTDDIYEEAKYYNTAMWQPRIPYNNYTLYSLPKTVYLHELFYTR